MYKRKTEQKGEEVGGIVPHVTLKSIANNEPPEEEVLVDRPEFRSEDHSRHRTVLRRGHDPDAARLGRSQQAQASPGLEQTVPSLTGWWRFCGSLPCFGSKAIKTVTLKNVRPPAKSLSTCPAEAD